MKNCVKEFKKSFESPTLLFQTLNSEILDMIADRVNRVLLIQNVT